MTTPESPSGDRTDPIEPRLDPPWAWRFLVQGVVWFLRVIGRWRFSAATHGPMPAPDRPLVVVANHTGYLEPFGVAHAVWRLTGNWVRPLAKAVLFDIPVLGFLARRAGGIAVARESTVGRKEAYAEAVACLDAGGSIYVAPEGTITHDGELLPLRHGAARLALQAGCDVLVVTHFGGQRAFSPVVKWPDVGAHFSLAMELVSPVEGEDEASLTGRIAATMLDRSAQLREDYPQRDLDAVWWPPYADPGTPTRTARENVEQYREAMAEAIEQARERMAVMTQEGELEERVATARERARAAAEAARHRAEELGDQLRHRADELAELARRGELGETMRHRAEELAAQARLVAEHAAELREELRAERATHRDEEARGPVLDETGATLTGVDTADEDATANDDGTAA